MNSPIVHRLLAANYLFYQKFGAAFAQTRRRIQPGVRRIIASLPVGLRLLDLGCGSGALALELARLWQTGSYLGLDASDELLAAARQAVSEAPPHATILVMMCSTFGLSDKRKQLPARSLSPAGNPFPRLAPEPQSSGHAHSRPSALSGTCLLYTSDAADDPLCLDLGGRPIL